VKLRPTGSPPHSSPTIYLATKLLQTDDHDANTTDQTVWLVRDPRMGKFVRGPVEQGGLKIPCLIADEAHIYLRNSNSGKGTEYNRFFPVTDFVVHVSGTLFPLEYRRKKGASAVERPI